MEPNEPIQPNKKIVADMVQLALRVGQCLHDPASAVSALYAAREQYRKTEAGDPTQARVSPAFYTRLEHEIGQDVSSLFGLTLTIDSFADPVHLS